MSKWHALEGTSFAELQDGVELTFWPVTSIEEEGTSISDALADPDGDALADAAAILLPEGAAWSKPGGEALPRGAMLWRFWRAAVEPMVQAYRDAWRVAMDSTSITIAAALDDWEEEFGLPDPCVGVFQSDAKRRRWLRNKVLSTGVISPGDFLNLAEALGYSVVIEEPVMFEAGASDAGGPDETGTYDQNHIVTFWILGAGEYGFEAGIAEAGFTPLYDFDHADAIECSFRRLLPAGYRPIFDYSEATTFTGWPEAWPSRWE